MKKTTKLKNLINSEELVFLMEAHNGLSAKIVEEAGFDAIWGSGLSISAAAGVRDNNELSWTQVLEIVELMSDNTNIPILLDGDTGHGNFNNMRRFVKKLCQRNVAGVCIEDKIFPKTNSFLREQKQPLAAIEEFAGKIKAGVDARPDDDFCIVARVEAFISGWGLEEALKRAYAYHEAGASAILMHSKIKRPDEIFAFMDHWDNRCPVIIVPTKYYATPTEQFRKRNISAVIWANHLLRSSLASMQKTAMEIYTQQSLIDIEDKVAPLEEVFRLQNDKELIEAEKKYLSNQNDSNAIILAASKGKNLDSLVSERPKTLLRVNGTPLLELLLSKIKGQGVQNIHVIRGYKKEVFPELGCHYINNDEFENNDELSSLILAKEHIKGKCIISYGDIIFKKYILGQLDQNRADIKIVVDSSVKKDPEYVGDFVTCTSEYKRFLALTDDYPRLTKTNLCSYNKFSEKSVHGEWIGLLMTTDKGSHQLRRALDEMEEENDITKLKMGDLLNHLIKKDIEIGVEYIDGHWMDIDNIEDFEEIQVF